MDMSASAQNLIQMLHGHPYKTTVHKFYDRCETNTEFVNW